ncbi:hypothetical protein CspeluHIS016_0501720 [Cutaneotrichosporon spelunceum]|uniref:CNH-domain-containing protein n=1 Tax=Cutaneotrichosporon spelunceum TaxID=1672016 RepID=A0AAD3TWC1_9TREE|nr:hypothetical protein CspeluHIS016_0501720 [Cutaneotrichosporon spelunceum]
MAPGGPRARPSQPQQGYPGRPPPPTGTRNEVFENIFGRPSVAHHLNSGPPGHPGMGRPVGYGGAYGPPMMNPAQPGFPPANPNPALPSFPPGQFAQGMAARPPYPQQQGQHRPPQRQLSHRSMNDRFSQGPVQQQASPYDGVSMYDGPQNGHGATLAPSRAPPSAYQGEPPVQLQQANVPTRRHSLVQTQRPTVPPPGSGGFDQTRSNGAQYNGYARPERSERLPHLSAVVDEASFTQMPVPRVPQPRSVSTTSGSSSNTVTSVPPRSRSLHHQAGRGAIGVRIPSPTLGASSMMPFPEAPGSDLRAPSPPPAYQHAMAAIDLNSERGTPYSDISGLPRSSGNIGRLLDPPVTDDYFGSGNNDFAPRPSGSRHMSSSSAASFQRSMHMRQPSDSSISSSIYTQRVAPLSQISNSDVPDSPLQSPSTPTGSDNGYGSFHRLSGRRSMESTHSLPLPGSAPTDSPLPPGAASSVFDHRAMSFSGSGVNRRDIVSAVRSSTSTVDSSSRARSGLYGSEMSPIASQRSLVPHQSTARKAVLTHVTPALLSNVAEAFRQLVQPHEILKDGIAYKDAFDGRLAVTIIADIIKTPDRNLALLLGRALDAQKFFHDVTYAHRLRDTDKEVYQFKERLVAPFMNDSTIMDSPSSDHLSLTTRSPLQSNGSTRNPYRQNMIDSPVQASDSQADLLSSSTTPRPGQTAPGATAAGDDSDDDDDLPNGVFTLLTDCYSPTCSREQLCYSINCPRRVEQMKRLNVKSAHPGLQRKIEEETVLDDVKETGTLWIHSVSQEILDSVDDREKKRQEAINEVIYTERDFVRGLEYMRDSWVKPLRSEEVIPTADREEFIRQVFWNFLDVLQVNHVLAERLTKRQKQQPVVQSIGDIFLECVPHFEPFVVYGAHQLFGKYEFEKQKTSNPAFQKFVDETERKPESHKLELNGYLTKPTTRLGRYPLLLEAVLKYTPDDHPDKTDLPEVVKMIRSFLAKVNEESGKSENIFELAQLESQLVFRPQENIDLRLRDKNRELIHKGPMKRRGGTQGENADLLAFLFDHAFLLVKSKWINKTSEQYKVYRRPIPLELLVLQTPEDSYNSTKLSTTARNKLISRAGSKANQLQSSHVPPKPESKHGFSITVTHLGRKGYQLQLWVESYVSRKKWVESIEKQQQTIRDRSTIFQSETITEGFFQGLRRINCLSPYDNGNRMIYGTDEGVYFSNLRDPKLREPVKVINLTDVTQVDVIEELQLLIVLHERSVTTFPLDCLDPNDPNAALKRGKRISSHTSFFKSGICLGRTLVAVVKSSPLSSTIKVLEPVDQSMRGKKQQRGFMGRLNNSQDTLKVFKEFYIPFESFSVYFLKTKLCVGCQKGFEIVDLETLDMQSLLDPSDPSLDFVLKRDGVRPMAIYRIEGDFLLCYDEFAFYVNKNGWRARPKWAIIWEGTPTAFALQYPYVIAFEPTFIEVRHVESGHLVQIIPASNISCLFADTPPSTVNAPTIPQQNRMGSQMMYPHPQQGMYRPQMGGYAQQQSQGPYGYPQAGYPQMRPPMPQPYGMPPQPMAPIRNFLYRPQVIFGSEDGHVQFLKLPPPRAGRRSSDSRSVHSMR